MDTPITLTAIEMTVTIINNQTIKSIKVISKERKIRKLNNVWNNYDK